MKHWQSSIISKMYGIKKKEKKKEIKFMNTMSLKLIICTAHKSRNRVSVRIMVLNTTFNNISAISWGSALLVEKNRSTLREPPTCRKSLTNYHIRLYQVHLVWAGFELAALVVIGTDCIGSYKSNYHTITTTMAPQETWLKHSRLLK
jgi:hypothetical protein